MFGAFVMFGIASIIISYLLITSILMWGYLGGVRSKTTLIILVPFIIWYSAVLYLSFDSLMGYPTNSIMPNDTVIYSYRVVEPTSDNSGGMYFWGLPAEKVGDQTFIPRSYRMDYDRELHKQLMKKRKGSGNSVLVWRLSDLLKHRGTLKSILGKRGKMGSRDGNFKIVNPENVLSKE